jgi:hypothetical protein
MNTPTCKKCGAELAPAEIPACFTCIGRWATTIGERALQILEQADRPLPYWDIQRLMDRHTDRVTHPGSVLVYLSRDLRVCWAGKGTYGLYRHGLLPNVRSLGPAAETFLLAAPRPINLDELHFVLQHQGYRYQYASLTNALRRHFNGDAWRLIGHPGWWDDPSERAAAVAELVQAHLDHTTPHDYPRAITRRVKLALDELARRQGAMNKSTTQIAGPEGSLPTADESIVRSP